VNAIYNAHFNFREAPFSLTPDPQFYYSNPAYREAWSTLGDGIQTRKGFILISGEAGTGKTTLLKKALQDFGSKVATAYLYPSLVGDGQLLHFILADLGLPHAGSNAEMTERLRQYLIEQFEMGSIVALLIDEAQNLSVRNLTELKLLGNWEIAGEKLVQIVLVGQPELEEKLERAGLVSGKTVLSRCRLGPIGSDEVGPYIDARLHNIGHLRRDLFTPEAVEKIALYSSGIPRLINNLCDNALLIAYAESRVQISAAMVEEAAADLLLKRPAVDAEMPNPTMELPMGRNDAPQPSLAPDDPVPLDEEPFEDDPGPSAALNRAGVWSRLNKKQLRAPAGILSMVALAALGGLLYYQRTPMSDVSPKSHVAGPAERENGRDSKPAHAAEQSKISDAGIQIANATFISVPDSRPAESNPSPAHDNAAINKRGAPAKQAAPGQAADLGKRLAAPARDAGKAPDSTGGNYVVAAASFVRNNPAANADVIATLEPGTRINATRYSGDYFRVRSLGNEPIRGYVHREDAFFERVR